MTSAVVVGSGPNGLAAALTLARAGLSVHIIEAAGTMGGGLRSAELTLPGLIHDECAGFHPFVTASRFATETAIATEVPWRWAPHQLAHPLDGGTGAVLDRSVSATADGLGPDGPSWSRMYGPLTKRFDAIAAEFLQPMLHLPQHPLALARFGAYAATSVDLLVRRWSGQPAKALFAGIAAHSFTPLNRPLSSAAGVALSTAAHRYGWPVAQGGSATIASLILEKLRALGVTWETDRTVTSLDELGPRRPGDLVMLNLAPRAALRLLGPRLPEPVARSYRRFRYGPGAFKVEFAVEGEVPWSFEPARRAGTVHVGGTHAEIAAAEALINRGRMPGRPFVLVGQQYVADPSRSADGVHPLSTYAHVPAGFTGDATAAILGQLERFAPGFRERVRATYVRTTTEMAQHNPNYVGGDIATGAATAWQLLARPRLSPNPYASGVDGVYLCSAATAPGAGAHGMGGYLAAQAALARLTR